MRGSRTPLIGAVDITEVLPADFNAGRYVSGCEAPASPLPIDGGVGWAVLVLPPNDRDAAEVRWSLPGRGDRYCHRRLTAGELYWLGSTPGRMIEVNHDTVLLPDRAGQRFSVKTYGHEWWPGPWRPLFSTGNAQSSTRRRFTVFEWRPGEWWPTVPQHQLRWRPPTARW